MPIPSLDGYNTLNKLKPFCTAASPNFTKCLILGRVIACGTYGRQCVNMRCQCGASGLLGDILFFLLSAFCDVSLVAIRTTVKNLATVRAHPILLFSLESDSCSHPSSSSAGSLSVLAQVLSERSRLGLLLLLADLAQSPDCI